MRHLLPFGVSIALLALGSTCGCGAPAAHPVTGPWRAALESPGGPLPFGLVLEREGPAWSAVILNGIERLPVDTVTTGDGRLRLALERYDSVIDAAIVDGGERLVGRWTKTVGAGERAELPFRAVAGPGTRFARPDAAAPPSPELLARLDGRWTVNFEGDDDPAVGLFDVDDSGRVEGTFLTTTGDYRFLEGDFDGARLRLSCFDGAHAFLFDARIDETGRLSGEFWSRDTWHQRWSARRDPSAELPDSFSLTGYRGERSLAEMVFRDLDGTPVALDDAAFAGKARIIEVFGSWCPNCNDSIAQLVELDRRYAGEGLSIVGVAFELTGDFERDARQVRRFAEHHDVGFPLLVGGVSDKAAASEAFPLLDRVRSYPTTIFLRDDGRVRAVHQGYAGPATGEAHLAVRRRFDAIVRELLGLGAPG